MCPNPWLVSVQVLERVLLLVRPIHVHLLVEDRVPPDVKKSVCPRRTADKEGAKVEAVTILRNDKINRGGEVVASGRGVDLIEEWRARRMREIERVVDIDVTIDVSIEGVEDVRL